MYAYIHHSQGFDPQNRRPWRALACPLSASVAPTPTLRALLQKSRRKRQWPRRRAWHFGPRRMSRSKLLWGGFLWFSGCWNHVPAKQRDIFGVHLHNHGEMLDWRYFSAFQLSRIQEKIVFNRQRFGWSQTKHQASFVRAATTRWGLGRAKGWKRLWYPLVN